MRPASQGGAPPNWRGELALRSSHAQHLAREDEWLITIFTPLAEHLQSVGQLVVDLQPIAVWIVKINALLAHVIDDPYHLDTVVLQRKVGVLQGLEAIHLERKVMHTKAIRYQRLRCLGIINGREVDRMAMLPERHKHAAVRRILLHHFKAE